MTNVLHILTAVTRPQNLPAMAANLHLLAGLDIDVTWHIRNDLERTHIGGQGLKNAMLDGIHDGWIWICDDDNAIHPAFAAAVALWQFPPSVGVVMLDQELPGGRIRRASPDTMRVDHVDIAQMVVRRDVLGDRRLPDVYAGDGMLIERLYQDEPEQFLFTGVTACYYNRLTM